METVLTWTELLEAINDGSDIDIEKSQPVTGISHNGIKFKRQALPISIAELEFNFMYSLIVDFGCQSLYELSTGVGISTLSLALGAEATGGMLLTVDSYDEDVNQNMPMGVMENKDHAYKQTRCYRMATKLATQYEVTPYVHFECGWSPRDTIGMLQKHTEKHGLLEFVFLDCPKCDEDFARDLTSIKDFLAEKYIICVHDTHSYTDKAFEFAMQTLGRPLVKILTKSQYYPLAMISNYANPKKYVDL